MILIKCDAYLPELTSSAQRSAVYILPIVAPPISLEPVSTATQRLLRGVVGSRRVSCGIRHYGNSVCRFTSAGSTVIPAHWSLLVTIHIVNCVDLPLPTCNLSLNHNGSLTGFDFGGIPISFFRIATAIDSLVSCPSRCPSTISVRNDPTRIRNWSSFSLFLVPGTTTMRSPRLR